MVVNLINFDYLIYHVNPPRVNNQIDTDYLITHVSVDANAYHLMLEKYSTPISQREDQGEHDFVDWQYHNIRYNVDRIKDKYSDADYRSFNVAEYLQFLSLKDF